MLRSVTMLLEDIKAAVQPALEQDVDALYNEFCQETGDSDPTRFLAHLLEFGLINEDLFRSVSDGAARLPACERSARRRSGASRTAWMVWSARSTPSRTHG